MTNILLYLQGYRRLPSEDDADTQVWFKSFAPNKSCMDSKALLSSIRLLTSMWYTDESDVPILESALFAKACFMKENHAFMVNYDSSWTIPEIEKHAQAVLACTDDAFEESSGTILSESEQ